MAGKPNREILTQGKRYSTKKSKQHRVEEVTFDKEKRVEYLTGFHKRKLQRKARAQEFAAEQERLARLEERKKIREERQGRVKERLQELNSNIPGISDDESDDDK
ncbi:unnamed protein product [Ambrosiozyma monospora]|uniref:Unnamed protein product n=1 Tax=Ambrosiozyma monospora TaxID=43982 RepID=A0A9W6YU85_AMBMO|nr:unnamed protein product [Ambrosiozyma monospora]